MGDDGMSDVRLCEACSRKAQPYVVMMLETGLKLEAARNGAEQLDEQALAEAEKLARSFDAILCPEFRKLGPRLPGPDEWPFSQRGG